MATAATGLLCLLGDPVDHSLSPVIQGAALRHLDLDMAYLAFRVERRAFGAALQGLAALGCRGCNVTVPFKEKAAAAVDSLSPEARALGSVNTVLFAPGMTCGYNTDVSGVARTLEGLEPPRRGALLLGAGGAARAAGYVLARNGYGPVTVSNRGRDRAERLAADLRSLSKNATITVLPLGELPERPPGIVVNATSLGLAGNPWPEPVPAEIAASLEGAAVLDLVYGPHGETPLVAAARAAGSAAEGGEEVLLRQGAEAFLHFTGREAPLDVMRAALREAKRGAAS